MDTLKYSIRDIKTRQMQDKITKQGELYLAIPCCLHPPPRH